MAKNNAINNQSSQLTIDPGASGDSFIQFNINTTGEFRIGVDDDASDAFKISQGSALGTNDTFIMSAAGERTMPLQPAFLGYLGSTDSDVTGAGAVYTLGTNTALTESFDQGGDFTTAGVFTAPVTGRYFFGGQVLVGGMSSLMLRGYVYINTTSHNYLGDYNDAYGSQGGGTPAIGLHVHCVAAMTAGDTASFTVVLTGGAGNTADLLTTFSGCYFGGYLVC